MAGLEAAVSEWVRAEAGDAAEALAVLRAEIGAALAVLLAEIDASASPREQREQRARIEQRYSEWVLERVRDEARELLEAGGVVRTDVAAMLGG